MYLRPRRRLVAVAVATTAVLAAGIALTATQAGAIATSGPTLSATPSDGLDDGSVVHSSLTGASAYNGQDVYFMECNETANAAQDPGACRTLATIEVASGAASGSLTVIDGVLQPGGSTAECSADDNGQCDVVAAQYANNVQTVIASKSITFEPPQTPAVTAQPSDNLSDGDSVSVDVTGVPDTKSPVYLAECNTAFDQSQWFDGNQYCAFFSYTPATVTNHAYSTTVNVTYGAAGCDESASCVIAVLYFDSYSSTDDSVVATTPIAFAKPPVSVTVSPTSGLKDGQKLTVLASGVPKEWQSFQIDECNTAYVANHGGFGQFPNQPGCLEVGSAGTYTNGAMTTHVPVTDGPLSDGASAPVCDHATNNDCAIVLLDGSNSPVTFASTQPITFRPPVLGPATIAVAPSTGVHGSAPVKVSTTDVADGIQSVDVLECNVADLAHRSNFYGKACYDMSEAKVTNNAISKTVAIYEGQFYEGESLNSHCDPSHACEIGLFLDDGPQGNYLKYKKVSNLVPIKFRKANRGMPALRVSKSSALKKAESITATLSHVSDLIPQIVFSLCNVKATPGKYADDANCRQLTPDGFIVRVNGNVARSEVKVFSGMVGETDSGKKVYCNAKTNGQCALVAFSALSNAKEKFLAKSKSIRYS